MSTQNQTTSLSSAAMLVDLNLSVWTGRKMDKKVSAEIDGAKKTKAKAGAYHKSLLAGTDKLTKIQSIAGAIRTWHYGTTTPWSDNGTRLLPTALFMQYKQELALHQQQFNQAVAEFLAEYNTLISAAAFTLGDLFDRTEYPDVDTIRHKFNLGVGFMPVPDAGDFRVDIGNTAIAELQQQYQGLYERNVQTAMQDAWDRLHKVVASLSERIGQTDEGKNKIFRDTLVTNATELCELLKALNITQDTKLEAMRVQLADALMGVEPQDLRDDDLIRRNVKTAVDDLMDKFNF
jgi:hypothetical protein